MTKIIDVGVIKKRPVLTGAVIIGGGLIFYLVFLRGNNSSQSSSPQMGYTDSMLAAGNAVSAGQMEAMLQGQAIQGQIAMAQIQSGNQMAIAQGQQNLEREIAAMGLEAARLGFANEIYGMQTSADIQKLTIESQLTGLQIGAERDLMMHTASLSAQQNVAEMGRDVQLAGIFAQENISRHTLDASVAMNSLGFQTQIALSAHDVEKERIRADQAKHQASTSASASKSKDKSNLLGSIVGGVFSLFSDIEIKSIEGCVDSNKCLSAVKNMPIDFWRYIEGSIPEDGLLHAGTYAQDFYREIGARDWNERKQIAVVDYMGALTGAIKALENRDHATKH